MRYLLCATCLTVGFIILHNTPALAQDFSSGIAQYVEIPGGTSDGSIICGSDKGHKLCDTAHDPNMVGVVNRVPAVSFGTATPSATLTPVVESGITIVQVSGENGKIEIGDYVTSSTVRGVGVKALKSGYVLGTATESFGGSTVNDTGTILVNIGVRPAVMSVDAGGNLVEMVKQGMEAAFLTPLSALRYITAGLLALISVGYGLFHFGKLAKSGVDAVGRNPLASRAIQMSVILNVVLTMVISGVGVLVAYLVLIL